MSLGSAGVSPGSASGLGSRLQRLALCAMRKTRSMQNLAMLAALGKEHELKLHIGGALNNGLTKEEIREVFMQVAICCGVPAAVVCFRCAKEVFKERGV